jgi:protein Tob/BTG
MARYANHWFPEHPYKGSAFRCIRIVKKRVDPVVTTAASEAGIAECRLQEVLPSELTLWVDPNDVSYRFGEDGSIGVVPESNRTESTSSTSRDIFDNCRNEHMKRSEFIECSSAAVIAV